MGRGKWTRRDARRRVESVLDLDIRPLARGWLPDHGPRPLTVQWSRGGWWSESAVSVVLWSRTDALILYSADGDQVSERIGLDSTPCNYGGRRWWWLCPMCGQRRAILYLLSERFECRTCCGLTYTTSQVSRWIRHTRKSSRIRHRLGCGVGEPLRKPAGMHWRTFERLLAEYRAANAAAWEGLAPLLERRHAERTQELEALGLGAQGGRPPTLRR